MFTAFTLFSHQIYPVFVVLFTMKALILYRQSVYILSMKIAIASDHAGFDLKQKLIEYVGGPLKVLDLGAYSTESVDYPDFGRAMGETISGGDAARGILVCGSGIGISIAANRFAAVRAALCTSAEMAMLARQHNDANVLVLGARIVDEATARACVDAFLKTEFEGGRHAARVQKLSQ